MTANTRSGDPQNPPIIPVYLSTPFEDAPESFEPLEVNGTGTVEYADLWKREGYSLSLLEQEMHPRQLGVYLDDPDTPDDFDLAYKTRGGNFLHFSLNLWLRSLGELTPKNDLPIYASGGLRGNWSTGLLFSDSGTVNQRSVGAGLHDSGADLRVDKSYLFDLAAVGGNLLSWDAVANRGVDSGIGSARIAQWDSAYSHSLIGGANPHGVDFDLLLSHPITLEGYGITDAYTKTESINLFFNRSGDTLALGEGLEFTDDGDYFGTSADARIINILDTNGLNGAVDGGLVFNFRTTSDDVSIEGLRLRLNEFKWKGDNIATQPWVTSQNYVSQTDTDDLYVSKNGVGALSDVNVTSDTQAFIAWTSATGAPGDYYTYLNIDGGYDNRMFQFASHFGNSNILFFRSKYDTADTWLDWERVVTSNYGDTRYFKLNTSNDKQLHLSGISSTIGTTTASNGWIYLDDGSTNALGLDPNEIHAKNALIFSTENTGGYFDFRADLKTGVAHINTWSQSSSYARFGHWDYKDDANIYGFMQSNTGDAFIKGTDLIYLRTATGNGYLRLTPDGVGVNGEPFSSAYALTVTGSQINTGDLRLYANTTDRVNRNIKIYQGYGGGLSYPRQDSNIDFGYYDGTDNLRDWTIGMLYQGGGSTANRFFIAYDRRDGTQPYETYQAKFYSGDQTIRFNDHVGIGGEANTGYSLRTYSNSWMGGTVDLRTSGSQQMRVGYGVSSTYEPYIDWYNYTTRRGYIQAKNAGHLRMYADQRFHINGGGDEIVRFGYEGTNSNGYNYMTFYYNDYLAGYIMARDTPYFRIRAYDKLDIYVNRGNPDDIDIYGGVTCNDSLTVAGQTKIEDHLLINTTYRPNTDYKLSVFGKTYLTDHLYGSSARFSSSVFIDSYINADQFGISPEANLVSPNAQYNVLSLIPENYGAYFIMATKDDDDTPPAIWTITYNSYGAHVNKIIGSELYLFAVSGSHVIIKGGTTTYPGRVKYNLMKMFPM